MDIDILLALQEFRNGAGSCLVEFMSKMSYIGDMNMVLIIMALIYWCVNKDFGRYLLMGWSGTRIVNGLLKVTACVYRPWIRDPRIVPDSEAIVTATGYSFPSGHTMNAAALYGGAAMKKELSRIFRIALALMVALIAFSRNFLGVHSPQDTLVAVGAGLLVMWLTAKLMSWIEKNPKKDVVVMCIGICISVAVAIYASLKSYPVDYDANGKLLVDGAKMAKDTFKGVGWCIGFLVGWVLESRYIDFSTDVPMKTRAARLTTGLLGYYVISLILIPVIKKWFPGQGGIVTTCFIQMFYVSYLYPLLIKHLEQTYVEKNADGGT